MSKYLTMFLLAFVLLPSSWQVWHNWENVLTVHYGNDAQSSICFQGPVEYYDGHCTLDGKPTSEYNARISSFPVLIKN